MNFLGISSKSDKKSTESDDMYEAEEEASKMPDYMPKSYSHETDSYKVVSSEINEDQADRMVQKLLKRKA